MHTTATQNHFNKLLCKTYKKREIGNENEEIYTELAKAKEKQRLRTMLYKRERKQRQQTIVYK
jgi:hypothetical protein